MSATAVLSQLKSLLEKTQQLKGKLSKAYPTDDQWDTLSDLSLKLSGASKAVQESIRVLKESRSERAWKESEKHRSKAQASTGDLFAKGRLKQPVIFRRNIVTIFEGPKDSRFDSEDVKFRKESTRKRCELIRRLSPDGIISWALSFAPTLWAGGSMASDVFTCLLDDIEPELLQTWPLVIRETLHLLLEDEESLRRSPEYDVFLKAIDDPLRKPVQQRKRRRTEDESEQRNPVHGRESVNRSVNSQVAEGGKAWPSQAAMRKKTNTESASQGDVFALTIEDARYALSYDEGVRSIFLTNPILKTESSFLTAWVSQEMGTYLGERGKKLDYKYTLTKGAEGLRREV
ncbi:hypothetical protein X797_011322 [Metarhizium robertsii]|uniref:Uncharacterized protein n=2 Tax=Metarhizium robertsii TaxID=568076 RepID=E9FCG6_METRA|nr:uncharacterized protein MAA_09965 [Metarhizium robertsii ARSEF 23]EFY94594.1 hypothetical protein MAA_09965 [Metarhizium robertsii ARSEF 23]EXU95606.1 hypothetical protein X797_011322 [Metarhizium robertsii]